MNHFLSRKAWILTQRSIVNNKVRKPVSIKWVFKSKGEADGLILPNPRNVVKGYMQVGGELIKN